MFALLLPAFLDISVGISVFSRGWTGAFGMLTAFALLLPAFLDISVGISVFGRGWTSAFGMLAAFALVLSALLIGVDIRALSRGWARRHSRRMLLMSSRTLPALRPPLGGGSRLRLRLLVSLL